MPCKTARGSLSSVTPNRITTLSEFVYRLSKDPDILPTFDAKEVRRIRNAVRLTQFGLGKLTGYGESTVRSWEDESENGSAVPMKAYLGLTFLDHFREQIIEILTAEPGEKLTLWREPEYIITEHAHPKAPEPIEDPVPLVTDRPFNLTDARRAASDLPPFSFAAVKDLCEKHHITRKALADMVGVSPSSVDRWYHGKSPSGPALKLLKILLRDSPAALIV